MKKKVWIMNHYATHQFLQQGGRHYWFAENLKKKGYEPIIFCANVCHYTNALVDVPHGSYSVDSVNDVPFVFVKTRKYEGNGAQRVQNMIDFYRHLFKAAKGVEKQFGKPDVILASSVHPLTVLAGIQIAEKMGVPCISEIRDLWPESIVAYGILERNSLFAKTLYQGEKWLYQKSDAIVMTWQGGKQYIIDRNWQDQIDLDKVHHISNGVIVEDFDRNSERYQMEDSDLQDRNTKNVIYAGSIRYVNNLGHLLDAAAILKEQGHTDIRLLIYGTGNEREALEKRVQDEKLDNVIFKGFVDKKYIPSILKQGTVNVLHNSSTSLNKYGQSQNKFFEYLAAGRCIAQTYTTGFSMIEQYQCGVQATHQTAEEIAACILRACEPEDNKRMGENARQAAQHHDFTQLTNKLIDIIETV